LKKYYTKATHNVVFNKMLVPYNLEKLRLVDSLVENEAIKNHLLKYNTRDFITVRTDSLEISEVLDSYLEKSDNDLDRAYMKDLAKAVNNLKPGNVVPTIMLLDRNDNEVELKTLISKPTVIYFWSSNLPLLLRNSHYKVGGLKHKFPEVDFIAININDDDKAHWIDIIKKYNFNPIQEYRFSDPSEAMKQLALNSVIKSIFVNKDARIVNANAMIITSEFEEELTHFLKRNKAYHK